jgi:hypothetical protein
MKRAAEARFLLSFTILIASVALPMLVRAVDYNVGVKVGDWIKYGQYTVTWSGKGTEPAYIMDEKKVDWARMDVENISGTTVTLNATVHFNNGTQTSQSISADIAGGAGMTGIRVLIASNLKAGDPILNSASSPVINQTITGRYASANRSVNLLNATSTYDNQTTTVKIYWDQSTGFMVEMYNKMPDYSNPGAYIESSLEATETNMWNADFIGTLSNNIVYIIASIIIIILVITAAIVLRRKKPPPPPPPLPT